MTDRLVAIQELIDYYNNKYADGVSFFVHPDIEFVASGSDGGGISVKAKRNIPKGIPLITIPAAERVSITHVTSTSLKKVLKDIKTKFDGLQNNNVPLWYYRPGNCYHVRFDTAGTTSTRNDVVYEDMAIITGFQTTLLSTMVW